MNYILRLFNDNNKLIIIYFFKITSLVLRLLLSLIIVRFLTNSDFNIFLRITTFSGFALTLLNILFQNLIFESVSNKINMRLFFLINILVFFVSFFVSYFVTNSIYQSSFVFLYLFTPVVYCFSIIAAFDNRPVISSFFENLFQNLLLLFFLIITYYFLSYSKPFISLNLLIFEIFISWFIVFLFCIYFFKKNIKINNINTKFSFKFKYIYLNTVLIYILTKLDLIILFSTFDNHSIVKEYYSIQKISEVVQLGSDVVWLLYVSEISKIKNDKKLLNILFIQVKKLNLIFLSSIAILLLIIFYLLNRYDLISNINNFTLIFLFLSLYVYSGYMNVYFFLLQITRNTQYISKTLLFTCFILLIEYLVFFKYVSSINLILLLVSTYIIVSKYLFFQFSKNYLL